ncbi:MAG: EthD domain-containing protein [Pseudomonadota bacterium]
MIRLTFLLRRRADLTRAAFQAYWRNEHGSLIVSHALALGMCRYVQVHTLDHPANDAMATARGGMEAPYDGVAELWFKDLETLLAANGTAEGRAAGQAILADEANFLSPATSCVWLAREYPQVAPATRLVASPDGEFVKLYFPLRMLESVDADEAMRYWHEQHGPLIRALAPVSGIAQYLQVHRAPHAAEAAFRRSRGIEVEPYAGHAEVWLRRDGLSSSTRESRAAGRLAIEDERTFIDFARSGLWLAEEHVLFERDAYQVA